MSEEQAGYSKTPEYPNKRQYRLDLKRCIEASCDGELAELSYYERNNWATVELQCNTCKRKFVVKVEI
ncbi:MAG TPA: hypothetical protein VL633_11820 [Bacteroidota bacterium]|jgi:hypothetical protein|nr:hypothetical protein [Bacteroidota bacterium]